MTESDSVSPNDSRDISHTRILPELRLQQRFIPVVV